VGGEGGGGGGELLPFSLSLIVFQLMKGFEFLSQMATTAAVIGVDYFLERSFPTTSTTTTTPSLNLDSLQSPSPPSRRFKEDATVIMKAVAAPSVAALATLWKPSLPFAFVPLMFWQTAIKPFVIPRSTDTS